MTTDIIRRRPRLWLGIVVGGIAMYWLLCLPLHGRRGFPELPPVYLAMIWMWIPPVILAAVFDDRAHRMKWLVGYGVLAGFLVAAGTIMVVPSYKSYFGAAIETIFYGPILILCVLGLDWLSRLALRFIRSFAAEPVCQGCGYPLQHLAEPRCPECGLSCDIAVINPAYVPPLTRRPWRLRLFILLILAGSTAFPFVHHGYHVQKLLSFARAHAEADWAQDTSAWHVKHEELEQFDQSTMAYLLDHLQQDEPKSGLRIKIHRRDWRGERYDSAHRSRIAELVDHHGRSLPPPY